MTPLSLQEYLSREIGYDAERMDGTPDPALARLITGISEACKEISAKVREGALDCGRDRKSCSEKHC